MVVTTSREDNIYYARLAEQGERYEDMITHMQAVANVSFHSQTFLPVSQSCKEKRL